MTYLDSGLFQASEVLERVGLLRMEGCLHFFGPKLNGNIYVCDDHIVAADCNGVQGHTVLHNLLSSRGLSLTWMDGVRPQQATLSLQIVATLLDFQIQQDSAVAESNDRRGVMETTPLAKISTGLLPKAAAETDSPFALQLADTGELIEIRRDPTIIGREATCDITLAYPSVSRRHCMVRITHRGLHISDLGSTNGTSMNGKLCADGIVGDEDQFSLGDVALFVLLREKEEQVPEVLGSRAKPRILQ